MTRVLAYGPRACLVEVDDTDRALRLAEWLRAAAPAGVEVVVGARTVLLDGLGAAEVRSLLPTTLPPAEADRASEVEIAVRFDGPDLDDVAAGWGCAREAAVDRILTTTFTAAFTGFAPGFAYLGGLPAGWAVPRRSTPRPVVAAGSVALADTWCGIYPSASPGGWQVVGVTDARLWDAERPAPALITPGTRVRFREA